MIWFILYIVIATASVFALIVGASIAGFDMDFPVGWILAAIFWPVGLLPAAAIIAAKWFVENKER